MIHSCRFPFKEQTKPPFAFQNCEKRFRGTYFFFVRINECHLSKKQAFNSIISIKHFRIRIKIYCFALNQYCEKQIKVKGADKRDLVSSFGTHECQPLVLYGRQRLIFSEQEKKKKRIIKEFILTKTSELELLLKRVMDREDSPEANLASRVFFRRLFFFFLFFL